MAELENAGLYQHKSEEAARLAAKVVGKSADRSPATRAAFREALKSRPRESIEDLLERSLGLSGNPAAAFAHQRFKYAINRLFCLVGWNINRKPLEHFLECQIGPGGARHTFVSFNYDLILEASVQNVSAEWRPETGYSFGIPLISRPGRMGRCGSRNTRAMRLPNICIPHGILYQGRPLVYAAR